MVDEIIFPRLEPIKTAARLSGLAVYRVRELCRTGRVACVMCGAKTLVNLDSLAGYLAAGDGPARREG